MLAVSSQAKIINFMGLPPVMRPYLAAGDYDGVREFGREAVRFVEEQGRKSHRTEGLQTASSYEAFLTKWVLGAYHTSLLRFSYVVVDAIIDRGVAQEWIRHQTQDFVMESQRYCNYANDRFGNDITFIRPYGQTPAEAQWWDTTMLTAEQQYLHAINVLKMKPEMAADALPRATACLLSAGGTLQAWRYFLLARTTQECHPKMLETTVGVLDAVDDSAEIHSLLDQFQRVFPVFFDDIVPRQRFVENMKKAR